MPRHVALLRGVSPQNAKSAELVRAFEHAGFTSVRTLLSSGNVAFDARSASESALCARAESAMEAVLGRVFRVILRSSAELQALVAGDPYAGWDLPPGAKRVVSFLPEAVEPRVPLPLAAGDARVLHRRGREVFTAYVPDPGQGPVFMKLIERAFGDAVTTRTWDTVRRCAEA